MWNMFANFTNKKNNNEDIKEVQRKTNGVDCFHIYILLPIRYNLGCRWLWGFQAKHRWLLHLSVCGLGDTVAKNIVREREINRFLSIEDVQVRGKVSKTLIDKMVEMGILEGLPNSNQLSLF